MHKRYMFLEIYTRMEIGINVIYLDLPLSLSCISSLSLVHILSVGDEEKRKKAQLSMKDKAEDL